jgi:hypothetical protein
MVAELTRLARGSGQTRPNTDHSSRPTLINYLPVIRGPIRRRGTAWRVESYDELNRTFRL